MARMKPCICSKGGVRTGRLDGVIGGMGKVAPDPKRTLGTAFHRHLLVKRRGFVAAASRIDDSFD
jgi:hypothetical protein